MESVDDTQATVTMSEMEEPLCCQLLNMRFVGRLSEYSVSVLRLGGDVGRPGGGKLLERIVH